MSGLGNKEVMAKNIKHYMEINNKTRRQVCADLGFAYSTFTEWLNAKKYPRIDRIEMMANYFGILKSDLIEPKNIMDESSIIGRNIRNARIKRNMSVPKMSKDLGIDENIFFRYEKGQIQIPIDKLNAIASYLNVSIDYLMGNTPSLTTLAEQIRQLRENKKLNLEELATEIHISKEDLEQYENGTLEIPEDVIERFKQFFGADVFLVENNQTALITKNEKIKSRYDKWSKEFAYAGNFTDEQVDYLIQFGKLLLEMSNEEAKQVMDYAFFITQRKQ